MTDIKALCERLQSLADEWHECCGDIHVPLLEAKATLEAQAAQDAVHWATRRTLLAERDSARAEVKALRKAGDELQSEANRLAGNVGCDEHDDIWFVLEQYENTRAALKGEET